MDLFWFELFVNLVQTLATGFFVTSYLEMKQQKYQIYYALGLGIVMFFIVSGINLMMNFGYENLYVYVYLVVISSFGILFSKNSIYECITLGFLFLIILSAHSLLTYTIVTPLIEIFNIQSEYWTRIILLSFANLTFILCCTIVASYRRKLISLNYRMFPIYLSLLFLINLCLTEVENMYYSNLIDSDGLKLTIVGIVLVAAIITKLFYDLQVEYHFQLHNTLLHEHLERLVDQYSEVQQREQKISSIKHDIKNKNLLIKSLIQSNQIDKALALIDSTSEEITTISSTIFTGNIILDSILNNKKNKAEQSGISMNIISNSIQLSDQVAFDISSILYNAIDNAMENVAENNKQVKIYLDKDEHYAFIRVINSVDFDVLQENPYLKTAKSDERNHGFGIHTMKTITKKYGGEIIFQQYENEFECKVVLPQKKLMQS